MSSSFLVKLAAGTAGNLDKGAASSVDLTGLDCVSFLSAQKGENDFVFNWSHDEFEAFKYLLKRARSILWLTRNVYAPPTNPHASLFVGLARTLRSEDSGKKIVTLDLGDESSASTWTDMCVEVFEKSFLAKQTLGPGDFEFSASGGRLLIPRLQPLDTLNAVIQGTGSEDVPEVPFDEYSTERLEFVLKAPGGSSDSRRWEKADRYEDQLGPREVELQFISAPLLDEDYETSLGHTTLTTLGLDICGRVKKVGREVRDLEEGDVVVGITLQGAFQSTVRLHRGMVAKVPNNDARLGSKFILSCYLAAWYAIYPIVQHVSQSEMFTGRKHTILVHHASSAHGQAAVVLARAAGIEVYATVSHGGSRRALQELGVQDDHISLLDEPWNRDSKMDIIYDPTGTLSPKGATYC